MADLQFVIDDRPTGISIVLSYAARLAVVAAFVFIGATKFSNNPQGEGGRRLEGGGGWWGGGGGGLCFRFFPGGGKVTGALLMIPRRTLTAGAFLLACT